MRRVTECVTSDDLPFLANTISFCLSMIPTTRPTYTHPLTSQPHAMDANEYSSASTVQGSPGGGMVTAGLIVTVAIAVVYTYTCILAVSAHNSPVIKTKIHGIPAGFGVIKVHAVQE